MKKFSTLSRLLIMFAAIIFPVAILGFYFVSSYVTQLETEALNSIKHNLSYTSSNFSSSVQHIRNSLNSIMELSSVNKLAHLSKVMEPEDFFENVNYTRDAMDNTKSSFNLIEHIRLFCPELNTIYNTTGYVSGSQSDFDSDCFTFLQESHTENPYLYVMDDHLILTALSSLVTPKIITMIQLDNEEIENFLSAALSNENDFFIFHIEDSNYKVTNLPENLNLDSLNELKSFDASHTSSISLDITHSNSNEYYVFTHEFEEISAKYQIIVQKDRVISSSVVFTYFAVTLVILILIVILFFIGTFHLMHKPLHILIDAFKVQGKSKDLSVKIEYSSSSDFDYLYAAYNEMIDKLNKLIVNEYKLDILLNRAQIKQLQAQINPHFLYNTYFMLYRMIKSNQHEESVLVAQQLGKYFEYITKNDNDIVPLSREYEHSKIYCNIQQLRFKGRIEVRCDELDSKYENIFVPNLILQPLIENAFNYGLENKVENGLFLLSFKYESERIIISIEDNGEELSDENLLLLKEKLRLVEEDSYNEEVSALINIAKRLKYISNNTDSLKVERSKLGGLNAQIVLYFNKSLITGDTLS